MQQLELVGTKAVLEKLIAEMDGLREQFIEVYLQVSASALSDCCVVPY